MFAKLSLAAIAATLAVSAETSTFQVKDVEFGEPTEELRTILMEDGIVALSNVPGLAQAREAALIASAKCVLEHGHETSGFTRTMKDSCQKSSWAAYSAMEKDEAQTTAKHAPMDHTEKCPDLKEKMEALRAVVDLGSKYFVEQMDEQMLTDADEGLLPTKDSTYWTFSEMLPKAQHLDHFNVYEKGHAATPESEQAALDMHTDQGLFIAIVPSLRVMENGLVDKEEDSFVIEMNTPLQETAKVKMPNSGDVLIFMIEDGYNYLWQPSVEEARVVPHALYMKPSDKDTRSVRAWFGRMFFAPEDAILENGASFQGLAKKALSRRELTDNNEVATVGCSAGSNGRQLAIQDVCPGETTAFCWMQCLDTATVDGDCGFDATCITPNATSGGDVWTWCATCHAPGTGFQCLGSAGSVATQGFVAAFVLAIATFMMA